MIYNTIENFFEYNDSFLNSEARYQVYLVSDNCEQLSSGICVIKKTLNLLLPEISKKYAMFDRFKLIDIGRFEGNIRLSKDDLGEKRIYFFDYVQNYSSLTQEVFDRQLNVFIPISKQNYNGIQNRSKRDCFERILF